MGFNSCQLQSHILGERGAGSSTVLQLAPSIKNQIFDLPQKIGDVGLHKRLWSGTLWGSYLVIDGDCLCRWWTGTCVEEVTGQGDPAGVGCKELACSQGWDPELLGGP